jgi:Domain of unknown function (DUF4150)
MANEVFANMMEVSCKAGAGKTICAFPDVCFTPPLTPATPPGVPIPYPNTGMSSDCASGSATVKISGSEVMLKNKSYFKQSTGDEAGCAPKKGVVTSKIKGKVYFNSWSMDVKIEGENVVRHLDLTTHNHASAPGQTPPFPEAEGMSPPQAPDDCDEALQNTPVLSHSEQKKACKAKAESSSTGTEYQSHHVIQNSHFCYPREVPLAEICAGYSEDAAPCIALEDGTDPSTPHGRVSQMQKADATRYREQFKNSGTSPTYADARSDAKRQLTAKNPGPGLSDHDAECVLKEVDKQFEKMCKDGMADTAEFPLRPPGLRGKGLPGSGGGGGTAAAF